MLGEVNRAIEYYEQQLDITTRSATGTGGKCLGQLGLTYWDVGNEQQAIGISTGSGDYREIGNIDGVARHSFTLARLYTQQGDRSKPCPSATCGAIWPNLKAEYSTRESITVTSPECRKIGEQLMNIYPLAHGLIIRSCLPAVMVDGVVYFCSTIKPTARWRSKPSSGVSARSCGTRPILA